MRSTMVKMLAAAVLAGGLLTGAALADPSGDAASVRHLMMATFDRPEARLTVEPVTISGDVAIAGWAQGDMGGRALLRRKGGEWVLMLCSGDSLREAAGLETFGLPKEQAEALAAAVVAAEAGLDPSLLRKFSSFDGVVTMDSDGNHPPADAHGGGAHAPQHDGAGHGAHGSAG